MSAIGRAAFLAASLALSMVAVLTPEPAAAEKTSAAAERDATSEYGIGIEDVLRVTVWGEEGLDLQVRVRPDGMITVPLANDVRASGLTPERVRQEIARKLAAFIREPNVTVIVEEINSFRVYVLGEVNRQGPISFQGPTRLLQAIASAGGLTQFSKKEVTLLRDEDGVERRIQIDYRKVFVGDPQQPNLFLKPGDTILVE